MTRHGWLAWLLVLAACSSTLTSSPVSAPATAAPVVESVTPDRSGTGPEQLVPGPPTRPPEPPIAARYSAALIADHCVDRDLAAPPVVDPVLVVLDRSYALPAGDIPPDLVLASAAGLEGASGTKLVREIVVADLAEMRSAWLAAGLAIDIESAYRSYEGQAVTFDAWEARLGYEAALLRSARPGHSEHQLGTAIDVTSPGWSGRFGDWAVESAEGAWMAANAWEFGFVMSYPADGLDATCYGYEPWHYRWIGQEAAADHWRSGLPLRRFLERYVGT